MSMKYARFMVAIERLCKKHGVQISQAGDACHDPRICVESISHDQPPDMDIDDCTDEEGSFE